MGTSPEDGTDGLSTYMDDARNIYIRKLPNTELELFLEGSRVPREFFDYWISPDQQKVLFAGNFTKVRPHPASPSQGLEGA